MIISVVTNSSCAVEGSERTLWESLVLSSDDDEPDPGYPSQKDVSHFPENFLLRGMQGVCEGFVGCLG